MTKEQRAILKDNVGFVFYPYEYEDAINNHSERAYSTDERKSLATMGGFWHYLDNKTSLVIDETRKITVVQPQGVTKGTLTIVINAIESIEVKTSKGSRKQKLEQSNYYKMMVGNIEVDFENPITAIKLNFKNDLVDPLVLDVEFELYVEPPIDYEKLYRKNMKVSHATGHNLVNIYFQYANEEVDLVEVKLYLAKPREEEMFIGTFKVDSNHRFLAINNLAYGSYAYEVVQYSKNAKIVTSEKEKFHIEVPNYGGRHTVRVG